MPLGKSRPRSGAYDLFQHVLRDEDLNVYAKDQALQRFFKRNKGQRANGVDRSLMERQYWLWKTFLISDHLPLWVELNIKGRGKQLKAAKA